MWNSGSNSDKIGTSDCRHKIWSIFSKNRDRKKKMFWIFIENMWKNTNFRDKKLLTFLGRTGFQRCKRNVNLMDIAKSFPTSIYYLLPKIDFDTANNESLKVCQKVVTSRHLAWVRPNIGHLQAGRGAADAALPERLPRHVLGRGRDVPPCRAGGRARWKWNEKVNVRVNEN